MFRKTIMNRCKKLEKADILFSILKFSRNREGIIGFLTFLKTFCYHFLNMKLRIALYLIKLIAKLNIFSSVKRHQNSQKFVFYIMILEETKKNPKNKQAATTTTTITTTMKLTNYLLIIKFKYSSVMFLK